MNDLLSYNRRFAISAHLDSPSSYMEAFRQARTAGNDYFGIVNLQEDERDIQITLDLYVGRTGSKAETLTVYRSGNDRFGNAIRRIIGMFNQAMPVIGSIVGRSQAEAVIDIGSGDCDFTDYTVEIVKTARLPSRMKESGFYITKKTYSGRLR